MRYLQITVFNALFLFGISTCFSQNRTIDSLRLLLKNAVHDPGRINALSELCFALSDNFPAEAIEIGKQAVDLAEKTGDKEKKAIALMNLGNAYRNHSNYELALDCFRESHTIFKTAGANDKMLMVLMNEAIVYWNRGELDKAIKIDLEVLKMAEQKKYPKMENMTLNNLGLAFTDKREYNKAIDYFEKAVGVVRKNNLADTANEYQNLGMCYYFIGDFKKAKQYYLSALTLFNRKNDAKGKMRILGNLGNLSLEQKNLQEAIAYYKESVAAGELLNDKVQMASILGNMAYVYSDLGDAKNAVACCEKALALAGELKSHKIMENLYFVYSEICLAANDHEGAYQNLLKSWSLRDSIFNDERDRSMREMETKYETEKKDSQIKLLHSEKEKQFITLLAFIGGLVLVLIFFIILFNRFRTIRRQKQVIELQKKEVEMQKHLVDEKQKEILDSIHYAKPIQKALMPPEKYVSKKLKELKNDQ